MSAFVSMFNDDNDEDKNEDQRLQKKMRLGYNKEAAQIDKEKVENKHRKQEKIERKKKKRKIQNYSRLQNLK